MKPPKPTEYNHGDVHIPTGRIFLGYGYNKAMNKWYEQLYKSKTVFGAQLEIMAHNAKQRAIKDQVPYDIDFGYLKSISTQTCPVFGIQLAWGTLGEGGNNNSPSLDKIKPEWGYVRGNVIIMSHLANTIKQDVGWEEIMCLAVWLKEKIKEVEQNVKPEQLTSIPTRTYKPRKVYLELGVVPPPGLRKDNNNPNYDSGAIPWEDSNHRAQKGSGDSMGHGGQEVGTPQAPQGKQNNGKSQLAFDWT